MAVSSDKPRLIGGYILWLVAGTIIGALASSLSASQFQQHVRVFYPPGVKHSGVMNLIAELAVTVLPLALMGPALGPAYYCWRKGLPLWYVLRCGSAAVIIGLPFCSFIQGQPDQPFRHVVPTFIFSAMLVALAVQVMLEDWVTDEPASANQPRSFQSRNHV